MFQGAPQNAVAAVPESYVVFTRGNDANEVVVRTLAGEYKEEGANHGRKVYRKASEGTPDSVEVYLYFWDERDGPAFAGWWFGNKLGGTQVWSHNDSTSLTPPPAGWKIPWDGAVRSTLGVVSKAEKDKADSESKLKAISGGLAAVLPNANQALKEVETVAGDYTNLDQLKAAEQILMPQLATLNEAMKKVVESQRGAVGEAAKHIGQMLTQLRGAQGTVNANLAKIRSHKQQAEQNAKNKEAEDRDGALLAELMHESAEKSNAAEDAVEKAMITYEMVEAGGEDLNEVGRAVTETEKAAAEGQKAIGEARIFFNTKQAVLKKFETEKIRVQAQAELGKLTAQLQQAQAKLSKLKNVRQEFQQRSLAQKLVAEVLEKLTPAEVDTDRAEEATVLLSTDALSQELMQQAQQAVAKASEALAATAKVVEQKKKNTTGLALEEMKKMEARIAASQKRLVDQKSSHKEASERLVAQSLEAEATEKLQAVSDAINKAADAEAPFLMGVEELPLEETMEAVKACEFMASKAVTVVAWAKMYIGMKLIDVRRFSAAPGQEAQERLSEFQKQLEAHMKRLTELKTATADRKRKAMLREVESEVNKVEDLAKRVAEVASSFEDDEKLFKLSEEEIRKAAEDTAETEEAAAKAMVDAKKFLTARQIESKSQKLGSVASARGLAPLQSRLTAAVAEVSKYKDVTTAIETRLAAKKAINESHNRLESSKERVNKVVTLVEALGDATLDKETGAEEQGSVRAAKSAEAAISEANAALKNTRTYVETQAKQAPSVKSEFLKLFPALKAEKDRLDALAVKLQERQDKLQVAAIVHEAGGKVADAEVKVKAAGELWTKISQDMPADEAGAALEEFEATLQAAASSVGSAKTFLAMKRIAAKRLAGTVASFTTEELNGLQSRVETAAGKTGEMKKGLGERKAGMVKKEVAIKMEAVEKAVEEARAATVVLLKDEPLEEGEEGVKKEEGKPDMSPEEMKAACEKSDKAQAAAHEIVEATSTLLLNRQRDAKTGMGSDPSLLAEIAKSLDKLSKMQAGLEKLRTQLREQEHRFVAGKLLKDATKQIENLERKLEEVTEICAPAMPGKDDFCLEAFKVQVIDLLKGEVQKESTPTPQALFTQMGGQDGKLSADKFGTFVLKLAEEILTATDVQAKAVFKLMCGSETEDMSEETFLGYFRSLYRCSAVVSMTETITVKGAKTIRKLQKGEVVEALSVPEKEETLGLKRVKAKAEKDGLEGFITLAGNQGTVFLEPYVDAASKADVAAEELAKAVSDTMRMVETKVEELKTVRSGPLAETKQNLIKMKPRISKVHHEHASLIKKMSEAKRKHDAAIAAEKKRRQEVADKAEAQKTLSSVNAQLDELVAQAEKVIPVAEALAKSKGADEANPLEAMDKANADLQSTLDLTDKLLESIRTTLDSIKSTTTRVVSEVRNTVMKHKSKVAAIESKCKKQAVGLRHARGEVADAAHQAVMEALRAHVHEKGSNTDAFFSEHAKGQDIPLATFRAILANLPGELTSAQLDLGLERYHGGIGRLALCSMLQEYRRVVKEIAVTSAQAVKEGKSVRKLAVGEIVEVLEPGKFDKAVDLPRVRCRALLDGVDGWVTLKGNQGTNFLDKCPKPYFWFSAEAPLTEDFDSTSAQKRTAQPGEVVELVQGPKKEASQEVDRVRVKAAKDGKTGWITMNDSTGAEFLKAKKLLICKQSIAITNAFDISEGKALRKLDKDETLEIVEEATLDEKRGLHRVKAKATRDQVEGWVTIKGNQGTTYSEESTKHFVCLKASPMEARFSSGSTFTRTLEENEVVEVVEGPKTEVKEGAKRVNGRTTSGDSVWFTLQTTSVFSWEPRYSCEVATNLHDGLRSASAKVVRELQVGEGMEALDLPVFDSEAKEVRVRVRAKKDRAVGFATVIDAQKAVLLGPEQDN